VRLKKASTCDLTRIDIMLARHQQKYVFHPGIWCVSTCYMSFAPPSLTFISFLTPSSPSPIFKSGLTSEKVGVTVSDVVDNQRVD
jgi:hypothetical protein